MKLGKLLAMGEIVENSAGTESTTATPQVSTAPVARAEGGTVSTPDRVLAER